MQPAGRVPAGHGHGCYNAVCERIGYHKCRLIWPQPTANVASHPQFYALSLSRLHERDPVSSEDVDGITRNGSARRRQSGVAIWPAALPLGPAAIRLVLPNSAPAGALVALVGINLPVAGTVHFGPTNISIASLDTRTPRTMVVEVPPGSPGAVQIEVAMASVLYEAPSRAPGKRGSALREEELQVKWRRRQRSESSPAPPQTAAVEEQSTHHHWQRPWWMWWH